MALLVVGDPYCATTHTDLVTRCNKMGVRWPRLVTCSIAATRRAAAPFGLMSFHCLLPD